MKQDSNYTDPKGKGLSDEERGRRLHRFFRDEQGVSSDEPSEVESRALRIMFTDEAGMLDYSWEQCLAMARREIRGGAANGGESQALQAAILGLHTLAGEFPTPMFKTREDYLQATISEINEILGK